jgi:lactate permease
LIAFALGAFIEGAAGFGTPVAISTAMLIGLGFEPLPAAGLALIGNTAPVAYGALGTPILTLAAVTKIPAETLSAMVGRQLPFFSVLVPFWLVWAMAGRKKMWEVWPACLTAGLSFAVTQFLVSNYFGPTLVDIAGAIVAIVATIVLLRFWQPRSIWRFAHDETTGIEILQSYLIKNIKNIIAFRKVLGWSRYVAVDLRAIMGTGKGGRIFHETPVRSRQLNGKALDCGANAE